MIRPKFYLIPGTMCNEKLWTDLVKELEDTYDLEHLAVPLGENIDVIVDLLIGKMVANDINLLGFSFGGYLASAIAIKIPSRISSLFIVSNSPCSLGGQEVQKRKENLALIRKHGYKGLNRRRALALLDSTAVNEKALKTILEMDAELGEAALVNQLTIGSERKDLARDLLDLEMNIMLIYSEGDPLVNNQWIADFQSKIPSTCVEALSGSGHMLPIEKPLQLASLLRSAL